MTKNIAEKSSHSAQIPERQHTADAESTNIEDGKEEDITRDTSYRQQNPKNPNVIQGYPISEEEIPIIGDLYRKRTDGIVTDTHEENRVNAEDKGKPVQDVGKQKRKRRRRI